MVNVIGVYCSTRLPQLSFCEIPDRWWTMCFHLENINLIGKCFWDLSLYSPTTAQHNYLFFKISIFVKSRIGDGLCVFIWKILIWLQNVIRVYCSTRLPQLSTTFVFKIPIFVKFGVGDGLCVLKMSFHLENINLIGKCYRGLLLYSPSTAQHNFLFLQFPFLWNSGSAMDYVLRKRVFI